MESLLNNRNSLLYYILLVYLLFKNPNPSKSEKWNIEKLLEKERINSILYLDPFLKAGFISKLIQDTSLDVLYLDLDLLYSGYVLSGKLDSKENVILFQPTAESLNKMIKEILTKASLSQVIIVVDSLNGLFNIMNHKKNVGRIVMSIIILLATISKMTNSYLVVASMVRFKKEKGWILSPTGKRLVETKNNKRILLESSEQGIALNLIDDSKKFEISADLIPLV